MNLPLPIHTPSSLSLTKEKHSEKVREEGTCHVREVGTEDKKERSAGNEGRNRGEWCVRGGEEGGWDDERGDRSKVRQRGGEERR